MTCPVAPAVRPSSSFTLNGRLLALDVVWLLELVFVSMTASLLLLLLFMRSRRVLVLLAAEARR
jgi:hypothetical protein